MTDTATDTTAARATLTNITWADFSQVGLRPNRGPFYGTNERSVGWEAQADLAHELAGQTSLSVADARSLISACTGLMPLVVTWQYPLTGELTGKIERKTVTVLVEYITAPWDRGDGTSDVRFRFAYWGFSHDVRAADIVSVTVPTAEIEYVEASR